MQNGHADEAMLVLSLQSVNPIYICRCSKRCKLRKREAAVFVTREVKFRSTLHDHEFAGCNK